MSYLKRIKLEYFLWLQAFFRYIPGYTGVITRRIFYKKHFGKFGERVFISMGCDFEGMGNIMLGKKIFLGKNTSLYANNHGKVIIGDRCSINKNVLIDAAEEGEIMIGNDVLIGPNVVIRASNHAFSKTDVTIREQGHTPGKIVIEDDVWIAANAVILPDCVIGRGSIVGAGAVVTKNVSQYSIVGGVPARIIAYRE